MTDAELFGFMDVFNGLARVFPQRGDEHEVTQKSAAYFKAMRRFPLSQVAAGAEVWVQRGKYFPKPAEWIESIPRAEGPAVALFELSAEDAAEYLDAERRHYEGDPCRCAACRTAGVDHRFMRFVPEVDANGRDAKAKIGERIVVRGHWAHGDELARGYAARDGFRASFQHAMAARAVRPVHLKAVTEGLT